VDMGKIIKIIQ